MYKMSIYNNNVETVVHFPSANKDDPHVGKINLKEGLSVVDTLSFSLYPDNQGYDKLFELTTKVKVIDVRDNSIRFTGRVLDVDTKMEDSGIVRKDVKVEGALSFLNDTKLRGSSFYADNVAGFLSQILGVHNSKVDADKRIQVGNVNMPGNVYHTCQYKTTFSEIKATQDVIGGQIRIREVNNTLYMDWLQNFDASIVEVSLGINMKDMVVSKDITSLGTRIIPLGANNLTIESVNGGLDYLEDWGARTTYGVIEKTVEYKDIQDAATLRSTCLAELSEHTQPSYILSSNALDLSYLTGNKAEQFALGTRLHLLNRFMGVDSVYSIVEISLDLLTPYNPDLTISKKPITLSSAVNDLRKSSIQNDGIYNNVQIGSSYGIRAVRSDNKITTTLNATDGISIQNNTKKVFYVDTNGNIVCNDGTFNNIRANNITAEGGTYNNITAQGGTFNNIKVNDITASGGDFDNITATGGLTIEDGDTTTVIDANGVSITNSNGYDATITVDDNYNRIEIPNSMKTGKVIADNADIEDWLLVRGECNFDDVNINGTVYIGSRTLSEYIRYVMG